MENKYQVIRDKIRKRIITGEFQVNQKLPTEFELMEQYDVSRYCVRRAINTLESENYIYRIQGGGIFVQNWHKFFPNEFDSKLIGVITTEMTDYIFPNIINGIDNILSQSGYSIILSTTHNTHRGEHICLNHMLDSNVAGLIIEPTKSAIPNPNNDLYQQIKERNIPMLFINSHYPALENPYIDTADFDAENKIVEYLFSLGHQSIMGIFEVDNLQGINRLNGFVRAYQKRPELDTQTSILMYQSGEKYEKVFQRLSGYLNQKQFPTAIACYNDQLAIEVINFLKINGMRVPEDVSVVGFDNYRMGEYMSPALTTLNHEKKIMGVDAAKMMIKLLHHKDVHSITYPAKIVERESAISKI